MGLDPENSHVASCSQPDVPFENDFPGKMCCKMMEVCYDSLDNDGDGFIDCADADCNGLGASGYFKPPEECTNTVTNQSSNYNTTGCIIGYDFPTDTTIYDAACENQYPPPQNAYCAYGLQDDAVRDPVGVCCPADQRPTKVGGVWQCIQTAECGVGATLACKYDFDFNQSNWLNSSYAGSSNNWCNSEIPDLYSPDLIPDPRSTGCCLIPKYGEVDYYLDEENVKIWG
jgi:hypothetical protein